jgi:hypothetical protein
MPILKLFLKAQTDKVPDDVLQGAGKELKGYFDQILNQQPVRTFTNVTFKINPTAGEVGDKDLLVYITDGSSFIIKEMDRLDTSTTHQLPPGNPGGGTIRMPDGGVCSEVYWTGGLMALKTSTQDQRAHALCNFIFHEWAHNKYLSDADALSKNEAQGDYVHNYCGQFVLQFGLSYGLAGNPNMTIKQPNIAAMLKVLGNSNKQYTAGLT